MDAVVDVVLVLHVLSGAIALGAALVAATNKKGATTHRQIGQVFFWAMVGVAVTAIPVTFVRPNPFLFFIALFSFYMAFAGYRRGRKRHIDDAVDVVGAWLMIVFAIAMVAYGVFMIASGDPLGWALASFGGLGATFGIEDVVRARRPGTHSAKVKVHLARMLGGTIATVTAVLVQQVTPLVESSLGQVALWLGPTIVLTPLIFVWNWRIAVTKKYRLLPAG
jgi:uncharacterized membrane protein